MPDAFICDFVRTPIGRFGGALAGVRADDLAATVIRGLVARNAAIRESIDEVFLGCANQAGEDNRNVARMSLLLGGLPVQVPGVTVNRLCASGLEEVAAAARAIRAGDIDLAIAGGVESMTRAPFVKCKADQPYQRSAEARRVEHDEQPRPDTTLEGLARLKALVREDGSVTAGNASSINDGAAAMVVASGAAVGKLLARLRLKITDFEVIEINEAFASQALACLRAFGIAVDADHVNCHGGAIALGHPLGMSGARIAGAAVQELERRSGRYGLATLCVGVGQGAALAFERVCGDFATRLAD